MRKFLIILSLLLVVLQLTGCVASDSVSTTMCNHDYVSAVTKEATYEVEGEITYTCSICNDTYTEVIDKLEKHVVDTSILDTTVSNAKYKSSVFSISVAELVNKAVDNYRMKHYTGEEAISKGYLSKNQIDDSVDLDYLYVSIISGDAMVNPDIPYLTEYEEEAVKVWMLFDENDNLKNYGVELCRNLQTCAILIMSSGY